MPWAPSEALPAQGNYENGGAYTFILLITFWILYSYLVPISLFVTMEIVKFWQVRERQHLQQDAACGHELPGALLTYLCCLWS